MKAFAIKVNCTLHGTISLFGVNKPLIMLVAGSIESAYSFISIQRLRHKILTVLEIALFFGAWWVLKGFLRKKTK